MKNGKEYLDKVINILEVPYFIEMGLYGIDDREEQKYVLSIVFGFDIRVVIIICNNFLFIGSSTNKRIYHEYSIFDSIGNKVYYEGTSGNWIKLEYENERCIYSEDSVGYWVKREYDSRGNNIYYETSDGKIIDNRNI